MYDFDVSPGTLNAVTDKLLPLIAEWRSRPLEGYLPHPFYGWYVF
jgi:transposase-like protein